MRVVTVFRCLTPKHPCVRVRVYVRTKSSKHRNIETNKKKHNKNNNLGCYGKNKSSKHAVTAPKDLAHPMQTNMTQSTATHCPMWQCPSCGQTVRSVDRYRYAHQGGKLAKHCGCVVRVGQGMTAEQLAAHRRQKTIELKRKYRREAGAISRADRAAMAAAKRVALSEARAATQPHDAHVAQYLARLCDAHVRRFRQVVRDRERFLEKYKSNRKAECDRSSKRKLALVDCYVRQQLQAMGIPKAAITSDLIELKRELISFRRLSRTIKSTVKNQRKDQNETLSKHT